MPILAFVKSQTEYYYSFVKRAAWCRLYETGVSIMRFLSQIFALVSASAISAVTLAATIA
ncbi:hypothetical protein [Tsuneonella troitsensis]|uniref:hypothetical protein n=1 Tax=Tsuneonella troitsensis TaxID=292222 RepID=UPI00128F3A05|nr:hypothetical protein [Tsuneonella troitsensis]